MGNTQSIHWIKRSLGHGNILTDTGWTSPICLSTLFVFYYRINPIMIEGEINR